MNLFQFILNLMEGMCLVQETWKFSVGWLKLTTRISRSSEWNSNKKKYGGKAL